MNWSRQSRSGSKAVHDVDEQRVARFKDSEPHRSGDPVPGDEASVALGFLRGKRAATKRVRQRVRKIVSYRRYGMSREDRHDVEQEVMTQLWLATRQRDAGFEDGFWGFVEVVAIRRCIDWLRTRRHHASLDTTYQATETPLSEALTRERAQLASATLERLDEPCRELIRLRVEERRSYRDIAALLGTSEGALRVRMHRCVDKAGEILGRLRAAKASEQETPRSKG